MKAILWYKLLHSVFIIRYSSFIVPSGCLNTFYKDRDEFFSFSHEGFAFTYNISLIQDLQANGGFTQFL